LMMNPQIIEMNLDNIRARSKRKQEEE
jgi:hypothetical protein